MDCITKQSDFPSTNTIKRKEFEGMGEVHMDMLSYFHKMKIL
jgi:hypothetical protein